MMTTPLPPPSPPTPPPPPLHRIGNFLVPADLDANLTRRLAEIAFFFTPDVLRRQFVPFVARGEPVSLRLVDWFVVNFVKTTKVSYKVTTSSNAEVMFDVAASYKAYLKSFRRRGFDVFRRFERVTVAPDALRDVGVAAPEAVETTVAQLNFFKWMMDHGVLDHLLANRAAVEATMVAAHRAKRLKRKKDDSAAAADGERAAKGAKNKDSSSGAAPYGAQAAPSKRSTCGRIARGLTVMREGLINGFNPRLPPPLPSPPLPLPSSRARDVS